MSLFNRLDLRSVLTLDAVASGAMGLLLLLGAGFLDSLFDLSTGFLRLVGVLLLPWAITLLVIASRQPVNRNATWFVIVANLAWVGASIAILIVDYVDPSRLGIAFIIVQTFAVGVFAALQVSRVLESDSHSWTGSLS